MTQDKCRRLATCRRSEGHEYIFVSELQVAGIHVPLDNEITDTRLLHYTVCFCYLKKKIASLNWPTLCCGNKIHHSKTVTSLSSIMPFWLLL